MANKRISKVVASCFSFMWLINANVSAAPFGASPETIGQHAQHLSTQLAELVEAPNLLDKEIAQLTYQQQVKVTAKALKLLAAKSPSAQQQAWVEQQVNSSLVLHGENPDHPEQAITLINISGLAKAVLAQWQVHELSIQQLAKIEDNQWLWSDFDQQSKLEQRALVRTINALSTADLDQLQHSLEIQDYLSQASNRTLASLLAKQANYSLSAQLYRNKADEFSYQQLAQVKHMYSPRQAVDILANASKNKSLTSMSLLTLSQSFADLPEARTVLINVLKQKDSAWLAATAISQSKNEELKRMVKELNSSEVSKAVKFAQQTLQEAEL